jgi:mRNA interferase RelE/StbE
MKVIFSRKTIKFMDKLPIYIRNKIIETSRKLEKFPITNLDIKKLQPKIYRIRIGKYRILFHIEKDIIVIFEINIRGRISYAKG